jgi:cyclic peptide transporter
MTFVVVLLYLIGPINAILGAVPQFMQLRIAWNRIQKFTDDIPANLDKTELLKSQPTGGRPVELLTVRSLSYRYGNDFAVGPISFEVKAGEILFIIGGNGSGKTTVSKLLTGLYAPDGGDILVDGKKIPPGRVGEFFSTVFSPCHLFDKLYDAAQRTDEERNAYLHTLQLAGKVSVHDNTYSTINLSQGQRKRLALFQCFHEDKPIYLFDEWAADQDPTYRRFFYRELLNDMRKQGKIIIAITHDDHYFDVADKILKLDMGKVEYLKSSEDLVVRKW